MQAQRRCWGWVGTLGWDSPTSRGGAGRERARRWRRRRGAGGGTGGHSGQRGQKARSGSGPSAGPRAGRAGTRSGRGQAWVASADSPDSCVNDSKATVKDAFYYLLLIVLHQNGHQKPLPLPNLCDSQLTFRIYHKQIQPSRLHTS